MSANSIGSRSFKHLCALLGGLLLAADASAQVVTKQIFYLTVAKHHYAVDIDENARLLNAGAVLKSNDEVCYDVRCCISLVLSGAVGDFVINSSYNVILGDEQLAEVMDKERVNYDIKVVDEIWNVRGGIGRARGVATVGTRNAVMEGVAIGNSWAHEFGHMKGISAHDDGCDYLIMNTSESADNVAVTPGQCTMFAQMSDYGGGASDCGGLQVGDSFLAAGGPSSVDLTWDESEPGSVPSYDIYRADDCWGPFALVASINSGDPLYTPDGRRYSFRDGSALYLREYVYDLRTGLETLRASASPTSGASPDPVGMPGTLLAEGHVSPSGGGFVSLTWSAAQGVVTGYDLFRASYGGMTDCTVPQLAYLGRTPGTAFTDTTPPTSGIPVSYRVRAVNSTAAGGVGNEVVVARTPIMFRLIVDPPGSTVYDNGVPVAVGAAGYSPPCSTFSTSATRLLSVEPTQTIGGMRYCFDSWSDGGFRTHTITVAGDTTITLTLVPSGSGPKIYAAGATVPPDISDCRSPHIFEGDAVAPSGLLVYPGAKLRFKSPSGSSLGPTFKVYGTVTATDATFETTDSTLNESVAQWSGITMASPNGGSFDLRGCTIRNANAAVATLFINGGSLEAQGSVLKAKIEGCTFASNAADIQIDFEHEYFLPTRELRLVGNLFRAKEAVRVTGADRYWYPTEPNVPAVIDSNNFAISLNGSKLIALNGGFTGQINHNNMGLAPSNTKGIILAPRGGAYPAIGLTGNKFWYTANRTVIEAPAVAGHPYLPAYYNDWGAYSSSAISGLIYDWFDTMNENPPKAEVLFEPFTVPPGGGGGTGCPFVFSDQGFGDFTFENSILGRSEADATGGRLVDDALPLRSVRRDRDGVVRLRIAEKEQEFDYLDDLRLSAVTVHQGDEIGTDQEGRMTIVRFPDQTAEVKSWVGRNVPSISPSVSDRAYSGEAGDSLELVITPAYSGTGSGTRRIVVGMKPKPTQAASIQNTRLGVSVRVASDSDGTSWTTSEPVIPRAIWSNSILPLNTRGEDARIRLVWHTSHSLGRVGIADVVQPVSQIDIPVKRAWHSRDGDVLSLVSRKDSKAATLATGEHLDLEFDAREAPPGASYVLLARGRYELRAGNTPRAVPSVYYIAQNRPNPFNPETEIEFGLPRESQVTLRVFDVAGRLVRTLVEESLPAGRHSARWNGLTDQGTSAGSGVYFSEIRAGEFHDRRRMVLLR